MDDQDIRRQELRQSVEASPDAPVGRPQQDDVAAQARPSTGAAEETLGPDHPVPITAWTSLEDARALAAGMKAKNNPAEWTFERLSRMIEDFESQLTPEEEVGAVIVGAPGEGAIHVDDIGFWGPDLILFYGKNAFGRRIRLVQHHQQLSVLLTALPREEERPARRIGFALRSRMEAAAAESTAGGGGAPGGDEPAAKPPGGGERP